MNGEPNFSCCASQRGETSLRFTSTDEFTHHAPTTGRPTPGSESVMASHRSALARPWHRLLVGAAAGSLVLGAAGCSSGGSGADTASAGGGDLSAAQKACVDKATKAIEDRGLLPDKLPEGLTPLSKPPTKGLTIARLSPGSVPTSVALSNKIVELAPQIGWIGKNITYDGSVEDLNRKALDAMNSANIVVVDGIPTAAIQEPIRVAKEKGVLLLDGSDG